MKNLIILAIFFGMSLSHANTLTEFACKSSPTAVVTGQGDFDQFEINGEINGDSTLAAVSIKFSHLNMRDSYLEKLAPVSDNSSKYWFVDGLDFGYSLELSNSSKVTIFSEGQYIGTELLTCSFTKK